MPIKDFSIAAQKAKSYVFDFNREIAAFYRDHPDQKKSIFFIDASTLPASLLRGDETDEDEIGEILKTNGYLHDAINKTHADGLGGSVRCKIENYDCVILKTPRSQHNINPLGSAAPADVVDVFAFDHEVGHLICENGSEGVPNLKECVADAYAVLRHFQRFGTKAATIGKLADMRALEMIFSGEGSHFTSPVVEQIIADSKKTDFSALSPQQTAELAQRYALDHAMDPMLISYMVDDFSSRGKGTSIRLPELGKFVLSTSLPEVFKWGAAAVRAVIDGQLSYNGNPFRPAGEEWIKLRQALDARETHFSQPQTSLLTVRLPNPAK